MRARTWCDRRSARPSGYQDAVDLAGQVEAQFVGDTGVGVPDEHARPALPLVPDKEPVVDRREALDGQPLARAVPQVSQRAAVQAQDPHRRVPRVAVLAVGEGKEPAVRGDFARRGVLPRGVDERGGPLAPLLPVALAVALLPVALAVDQPQLRARVVHSARERHPGGAESEPGGVAGRQLGRGRDGWT